MSEKLKEKCLNDNFKEWLKLLNLLQVGKLKKFLWLEVTQTSQLAEWEKLGN